MTEPPTESSEGNQEDRFRRLTSESDSNPDEQELLDELLTQTRSEAETLPVEVDGEPSGDDLPPFLANRAALSDGSDAYPKTPPFDDFNEDVTLPGEDNFVESSPSPAPEPPAEKKNTV